jgi:cation transport ATPase
MIGGHFAKINGDLSLTPVVSFFSKGLVAQWSLYLAPPGRMRASAQYWLAVFSGLTAAPVMGYSAAPFFRAAWQTVLAHALGMDFLVTLGASTSCLLSVWALFEGRSTVYFDSSVMIVTFLLIGRLLETVVRSQSSDAVRLCSTCRRKPQSRRCGRLGKHRLAKRVPLGSVIEFAPASVPQVGAINMVRRPSTVRS